MAGWAGIWVTFRKRHLSGASSFGTCATAYTDVSMTVNVMTIFVLCGALLTSACAHGQTADASCNLEPPDLPKLLQAIHPLIEKG